MAHIYQVLHNGSDELPLTDGTYYTDPLTNNTALSNETGTFHVAFYDAGVIVTPTAGTIEPEMSPIDGQWLQASDGSGQVLDATTVGADATYTLPVFNGPAIQGRCTFSGIVAAGATYAKAYFWRK